MEEIEGLTESSEEQIHEAAHEGHGHEGHGGGSKWVSWVALTTAMLAVVAAIAALLSGHNESESMLHQQQASDQWAYYQAKGIKAGIVQATSDIYVALGKPVDPQLSEKLARYKEEQKEISEKAKDLEADRDQELRCHKIYSPGITLLQIAIGIAAISVLTKKRRYFAVSLSFAAIGFVFFLFGLYAQFGPHAEGHGEAKAAHEAAAPVEAPAHEAAH